MANYSIGFKPPARKELESLPDNILVRIVEKIDLLAESPRPAGCKKLKGYKNQWRIRIGDWRVIYMIDDQEKRVDITRIAHRREAYE